MVPKGDRSENQQQFIVTARQLKIQTLINCEKLPKRHQHSFGTPLIESANQVKHLVAEANCYRNDELADASERAMIFKEALAILKAMSSDIDDFIEMNRMGHPTGLSTDLIENWQAIISKEIALINGVMNSDRKCVQNSKHR